MAGTTPNGLPYPTASDDPDVPFYMQLLAEELDYRGGFAMAAGVQSVTTSAAGSAVVSGIPLPAGRFTAAPIITVTPNYGGAAVPDVRADLITTTSFRMLLLQAPASQTFNVMWIAVQMTPTTAAG